MFYRQSCKNFAIITGKHLRWSCRPEDQQFYYNRLQQRCYCVNIAKLLRAPNFKKICKQLLLQFLLLTVNIFLRGLSSALNSVSLFYSRSSLRFKEFSLGCLVVDSSLIRKKEELAKMATRCHLLSLILPLVVIRCHSLSLFVTRCTTRLSFYKL